MPFPQDEPPTSGPSPDALETTPLLLGRDERAERSFDDSGSSSAGTPAHSHGRSSRPAPSWRAIAFGPVGSLLKALRPLHLENTGSVARDHLASERTFLAWLRTSLAFCSVGVALTQIFSLSHSLAPLPPPPGPDLALLLPDGSTALALEGAEADVRQLLVLLDEAHRSYGALVERVGKVDPMQAERARRLARFAKPLGGGLIATGFLILVIGLLRYFAVQRALIRGAYPATRLPVLAVSTLSGAFVLCVFAAVLMA